MTKEKWEQETSKEKEETRREIEAARESGITTLQLAAFLKTLIRALDLHKESFTDDSKKE